ELEGQTIFFPDKSDKDDGLVELKDVRQSEIKRRQRRLQELFEFMVDTEEGQRQARLHALDQDAKRRFDSALSKIRPDERLLGPEELFRLLEASGKRAEAAIRTLFLTLVGREPNDAEGARLDTFSLTRADADEAASASGDEAPFLFPSTDGGEMVSR